MEMFIWMAIVLKIPIVMLLWLCWYASRPPVEAAGEESRDDGGGGGHAPRPPKPRTPRRGEHADLPPHLPVRTRAAARDTVPRA